MLWLVVLGQSIGEFFDIRDQLRHRDTQRCGNSFDHQQRRNHLRSLQAADTVAMQTGFRCQSFLRKSSRFTPSPQNFAESLLYRFHVWSRQKGLRPLQPTSASASTHDCVAHSCVLFEK